MTASALPWPMAAKAPSKSSGPLASTRWSCTPSARASRAMLCGTSFIDRIRQIDQDGHAGNRGHRFLPYLEPFPHELEDPDIESGEVATGLRQALDHA